MQLYEPEYQGISDVEIVALPWGWITAVVVAISVVGYLVWATRRIRHEIG